MRNAFGLAYLDPLPSGYSPAALRDGADGARHMVIVAFNFSLTTPRDASLVTSGTNAVDTVTDE